MDIDTVWNSALTVILVLLGMMIRSRDKEIETLRLDLVKDFHALRSDIAKDREESHRLQVLINRTREEVAKEYVTKVEVHADINRVLVRLEQLDAKLDRLILEKRDASS